MALLFLFLGAALVVSTWPMRSSCRPRDGPGRSWRFKPTPAQQPLALAFDLEVFAQCLSSGLGLAGAMAAVGRISAVPAWSKCATLLALGVPAAQALEPMRAVAGLEELASVVAISDLTGAAVASGAKRQATALAGLAADSAVARAERAGVFISLPLALCFLPAFIIVGLCPIVVSLGTGLLSG